MLDFGASNSSEVHNNISLVFLDFSKVQMKDVHALQKVEATEIWIWGTTLDKQVKHSVKALNKLKAKMHRTTQEEKKE